MLFNSAQFLIFFPVVVMLYFALPPRFRWPLVLAAGYYFYACWRVEFLGLLIFSTLVDYGTGRLLEREKTPSRRKMYLGASIAVNLGLLFFFKYFNFVTSSVSWIAGQYNVFVQLPELQILLPVGLSFYTFQSLSYTIDVYRGVTKPEHHLGVFAAFVSFFPQLVAGPIERAHHMLPQFHRAHTFSWANAGEGLRLMLWGFVKKVAVADRLALYVNPIYQNPASHTGIELLLATYCFAFQIYCDFSGYTDIARGAARVMGFELMLNFRQPYLAKSVREFWQRWHISLSTWFRDYLYIPLGGSRRRHFRNVMITFLVSGLWHGASWTFVAWGGLHGVYLIAGGLTAAWRERLRAALRINRVPRIESLAAALITFHLVLISWILFRANSLADAVFIVREIGAAGWGVVSGSLNLAVAAAGFAPLRDLAFLATMLALLAVAGNRIRQTAFFEHSWVTRSFAASFLFWFIVTYGVFDNQQFIYFQF